ncbi:MAG TPA: type II secretion system secretin GspD [Kofleriaceae bacterium]|nr:type II secretion system secretin GspD [Kofleriaceae bacterium]
MRCAALVFLLLCLPLTAFAEETDEAIYSCKPHTAAVEITFKPEMELKDLLSWAVGFTCKKFVLDPHIVMTGRKVVLIAPGKQTPAQAYDMFTTALGTMGLTVVPKGKLMVVTESAMGKSQPLPLYNGDLPDRSEQMVRYLMRPQFAQPDTLKTALGAFKSDQGDVQVVGAYLLLTDHGSNVRDMASIAKLVDVPGGSDGIYAIPVHHADATKLVAKLDVLLKPEAKEPAKDSTLTPSKLLVDDRTNTLLVTGTEAAFQRVKALVERLDISLDLEGGTSMHVYQLGSAVAEELAKTLNEAIQAQTGQGATKTAPGTGGGDLGQLEGPVRVISDKPTNKLLVMASGRDFLAIREVIRELDVPRRQVYIEAMILEVQLSNGTQLGTSSHGGYSVGDNGSLLVGGVQTPELRSTNVSSIASSSGLIGGIIGKTLEGSKDLFGMDIPSYAILFQALADTSRTNILSTMPIIVVDNELAKYKVGTNVPYKKGVLPTSPTTATSSLSTNIEREPLLLELEVKPHISTDDSVLLEVKQSSKDIGSSDAELGPTWTERGLETRVLVRDQQTIVIGGLMQMRDSTTESKVPLLGDIPVLGNLFKYTSKSKKKMNLLIMLTPYIIKDHLDLEAIRSRKQREYDEFVGSVHSLDGRPYLPRIDYRRKRGLVEEINRTVQEVEEDEAARAAVRPRVDVTPGLIQPAPDPAAK